jgi:intein/homing endonuclease
MKTLTKEELKNYLSTTSKHKEIVEATGIPIWDIEKLITQYKLQGYRDEARYKCMEHLFTVESPEFCYLLGLYITDGYWNEGALCVALIDREVLDRLGKIFNCKVYLHHRKGSQPIFILTIPTKFCNYFKELGYSQSAKTFSVHMPKVPNYNLKFLMRGMIDGDGTIRKIVSDYEVRFFTTSKTLFYQYKSIVESLGYKYYICNHEKYGESIISINSLDFLLWLYSDRLDLCLDRKLKIVNEKVDDIVQAYSIVKNRRN